MRFGLLGPLEVVRDDGVRVELNAPMERTLLAALLLQPREVVSSDRLMEILWHGVPPANAKASLHNLVRRVRTALGPHAEVLRTRRPGYVLDVVDDDIDLCRFEQLLAKGRTCARDRKWHSALVAFDDALALWRGEPLADATLDHHNVYRWIELRVDARQWRCEALLALGEHEDAVSELQRLVGEHPLRERPHGMLMLAYYHAGRRADALAAFRSAREQLAAELGIEPSPDLRSLHHKILATDPDLAPRPVPTVEAHPAPAHLPAELFTLVGREEESARLDEAITAGVVAITGAGGIGKTSLALHWAHRLRDRFTDGQLFLDLQGFGSSATMTSSEALHSLLGALDIAPERRPTGVPALSGLYRSVIAGKNLLVFLDNARDADQIRPLLPGVAGCLTIITSRNALTGMVATGIVRSLNLGPLSARHSLDLLASRVGPQRLADEPTAAADIARICAGLPLALAVVAAQLHTSSEGNLADLAAALAAEGALSALSVDDSVIDPGKVFASSYRQLSVEAARVFRATGVLPSSTFDTAAVASAAGLAPASVRRLLAEVTGVGLVDKRSVDRYRMHDLIRAFATELIHDQRETESTPDEIGVGQSQAALSRVFAYYAHSAHAAAVAMAPKRILSILPVVPEGVHPAAPPTLDDAGRWFAREQSNLLSIVDKMPPDVADQELSLLAWALTVYLSRAGQWTAQVALQRTAIAARERLGDHKGVADGHRTCGQALIQLSELEAAEEHLRTALDGYLALGRHEGAGNALLDLAWVGLRRDSAPDALRYAERALELVSAARPYALNTIGWCHLLQGDHDRALVACREALVLHEQAGDLRGQAETWDSIGVAHHRLDRIDDAMSAFDLALHFYRANWDRHGEAETLDHQARAAADAGRIDEAIRLWRQSLLIYEDLGHSEAEQVAARLLNAG